MNMPTNSGRYYLFCLIFFICFILSFTSFSLAHGTNRLTGTVTSVIDGDSLMLSTDQGKVVEVRLYGIDCPEFTQSYGDKAFEFTKKRLLNQRISVEIEDTDSYGRVVGIVSTNSGTINYDLVASGLAWIYDNYCTRDICSAWKKEENKAKKEGRGLWADKKPLSPQKFRALGMDRQEYSAANYSGNTRSGIFHKSGCDYFNCKRCTARFSNREAAIKAGYRPCRLCRP